MEKLCLEIGRTVLVGTTYYITTKILIKGANKIKKIREEKLLEKKGETL